MDSRQLARIHRVRAIQLGLAQAEEARARDMLASEFALSQRIAQLADAIAPSHTGAAGFSFAAAAHYRERLHRSAETAANRVRVAEEDAARRAEATRAAHRDQTAVEKLIERDMAEAARRAIRALQEAPPQVRPGRGVRHDPC